MSLIPYQFQAKGARMLQKFQGRALLSDEMGLGKTIQALMYLERNPTIRPVVIVCPASLKWNWHREALLHFGFQSEVVEGLKPGSEWVYPPRFVIANYDILSPNRGGPGWLGRLKGLKPQCVVLDECQALQSRTTNRTKAVRELCKGVPHVLALSGTPLTNCPAEMFPVLNILRPDLFPSWTVYAKEYTNPVYKPWGWDYRGAKNLGKLHDLLRENLMIRRLKKDVLKDLPPKSSHILPLPLSDEAQYKKAHTDFLLWLAQHKPDRLTSASRAERLTKVGYLKRLAAELKLAAVCEWIDLFLEESEEKLVVFATHRAICEALVKRYKGCSVITGSSSAKDRREAVERFQRAKDCRLFVGNMRAAGTGLTLTASSTVFFAELDWVPGVHAQCADRCHRISQDNAVNIYYSIGQGTIEERLVGYLFDKQSVIDSTLDGQESEETECFNMLIDSLYREAK